MSHISLHEHGIKVTALRIEYEHGIKLTAPKIEYEHCIKSNRT